MNKNGLISSISAFRSTKDMQVLNEESKAYFNFINSLRSESTKKSYKLCLEKFLNQYQIDLESLLKLPQVELTTLIIRYLVEKKISKQYKNLITATLKHACEINDIVLNWRKIKKFINFEKTGNETNGKDRGYTEEEIQRILEFGDQRLKTAFLVLASTGIRVGALQSIRMHDLERIDNLYKVTVYSGDREEYFTFCTPECAKEIDSYLEYRKRKGEKIGQESFLLVRKFSQVTEVKGKPFKGKALPSILQHCIDNSGLRQIDHQNRYKRKTIPIFHGFRKFFTKQLVDSKLSPEIREMLLGHKIGLASAYYKPTVFLN
jgi:integrase